MKASETTKMDEAYCQDMRDAINNLETLIKGSTDAGRLQSIALTSLETAGMYAMKALAATWKEANGEVK